MINPITKIKYKFPTKTLAMLMVFIFSFETAGYSGQDTAYKTTLRVPMGVNRDRVQKTRETIRIVEDPELVQDNQGVGSTVDEALSGKGGFRITTSRPEDEKLLTNSEFQKRWRAVILPFVFSLLSIINQPLPITVRHFDSIPIIYGKVLVYDPYDMSKGQNGVTRSGASYEYNSSRYALRIDEHGDIVPQDGGWISADPSIFPLYSTVTVVFYDGRIANFVVRDIGSRVQGPVINCSIAGPITKERLARAGALFEGAMIIGSGNISFMVPSRNRVGPVVRVIERTEEDSPLEPVYDIQTYLVPIPIAWRRLKPTSEGLERARIEGEHLDKLLDTASCIILDLPNSKLLDILSRVSGIQFSGPDDISKDVRISYFDKGSHKYVFKTAFSTNTGEEAEILLAAKLEKEPGDIEENEMRDLHKLRDKDIVPKLGTAVNVTDPSSGKQYKWYIEEFVEGKTAQELGEKNSLSQTMRRNIIANLVSIAVGLKGWVPRDFHRANFVIRNKTEHAVMVDIGDRRMLIFGDRAILKHKILFIAMAVANYGYINGEQKDNSFIFDAIANHPDLKAQEGLRLLRDVLGDISKRPPEQLAKFLYTEGRYMFRLIGASKSNLQPIIDFVRNLTLNLQTYIAEVDSHTKVSPTIREIIPGRDTREGI